MKIIHETQSTRVTKKLVEQVQKAHEERKKTEPNLRVIDIWHELEKKVKMK